MIKINEIYKSIQGESSKAGLPCTFIRLTYCNLRCSYCDSEYSFYDGTEMEIEEILSEIKMLECNLVEVTGGEPLFQKECLDLLKRLCDEGYEVMLETGGSLPIENVDKRVMIILDLKCPSSGMMKKNLYENAYHLKQIDEIKFVIGTKEDYQWAKEKMEEFNLYQKCSILFSTVFGELSPQTLIEWILEDNLHVRFQLQLHKYIWDPKTKGV
ncbi:MAG: radical-activating enzyme radical SAM superfamily [Ignavibacteria bacterium]|nr:MAG: radical-activating enzyme radical SAM superfamily [Ignavibacteria bacterium]KAF0156531.1 MAG: radical-activating enzyme radical SAM superfamily [Ignavibacteria bacterium]